MNSNNKNFSTLKMAELAILTAIIAVLQLTGASIKLTALGTSISLVLIPIVLGAMLLGPKSGAFLGFVFGMITYLCGAFGMDAFTFILFTNHPILTFLTCIIKGVAAGYFAGLLYSKLKAKNSYAATFVASAAAPVLNTGIFILGGLTMQQTLASNFVGDGQTVIYFLVIVCAGINFLLELALNLIAAPALFRLINVFSKSFKVNK